MRRAAEKIGQKELGTCKRNVGEPLGFPEVGKHKCAMALIQSILWFSLTSSQAQKQRK